MEVPQSQTTPEELEKVVRDSNGLIEIMGSLSDPRVGVLGEFRLVAVVLSEIAVPFADLAVDKLAKMSAIYDCVVFPLRRAMDDYGGAPIRELPSELPRSRDKLVQEAAKYSVLLAQVNSSLNCCQRGPQYRPE